jgi:hypothetical protein
MIYFLPVGSIVPIIQLLKNWMIATVIKNPKLALFNQEIFISNLNLNIWPNPIERLFYTNTAGGSDFSIYNQLGQIVKCGIIEKENSLDLPAGLYFISITSIDGDLIANKRILIK